MKHIQFLLQVVLLHGGLSIFLGRKDIPESTQLICNLKMCRSLFESVLAHHWCCSALDRSDESGTRAGYSFCETDTDAVTFPTKHRFMDCGSVVISTQTYRCTAQVQFTSQKVSFSCPIWSVQTAKKIKMLEPYV